MRSRFGVLTSLIVATAVQLAGCVTEPAGVEEHPRFATVATASVMGTFLGAFGSEQSVALAVSRGGLIGGLAHSSPLIRHPVLFQGGQQLTPLPDAPGQLTGIQGLSDLAGGGAAAVGGQFAWTRPAGGAWSEAVTLPDVGARASGWSVNASGVIAGYLPPAIEQGASAGSGIFVTPKGAMATLWHPDGAGYSQVQVPGLPGCLAHSIRHINDAGVAAGWSVCPSGKSEVSRPFVSISGQPAQALPLGSYGSAQAVAISQAGHVVGQARLTNRTDAVLLWTPAQDGSYGPPARILDIDSNNGIVTGVNGCGVVIGRRTANGDIQGFAATGGQVTDLYPFPGSKQAWAEEINDAGTIVGYVWVVSGKGKAQTATRRATMWQVPAC